MVLYLAYINVAVVALALFLMLFGGYMPMFSGESGMFLLFLVPMLGGLATILGCIQSAIVIWSANVK